jgi:hypothetical protein
MPLRLSAPLATTRLFASLALCRAAPLSLPLSPREFKTLGCKSSLAWQCLQVMTRTTKTEALAEFRRKVILTMVRLTGDHLDEGAYIMDDWSVLVLGQGCSEAYGRRSQAFGRCWTGSDMVGSNEVMLFKLGSSFGYSLITFSSNCTMQNGTNKRREEGDRQTADN